MRKIFIAALLVLFSCNNMAPKQYRYTVWTGTAIVSVGDETDRIDTIGNCIVYTDKNGVRVSLDKSKVFKIEQFYK